MDFEQKFLEELEKYKRKRSLSALADKAGVGQSDLSRALGKKGQKLKIDNLSKLLKAMNATVVFPDEDGKINMPIIKRLGEFSPAEEVKGENLPKISVVAIAGAGDGINNAYNLEPLNTISVLEQYARPNLFACKVKGKSMEPTIKEGGYIGVLPLDGPLLEGAVYLVWDPNFGERVKRIFLGEPGTIILRSDNKICTLQYFFSKINAHAQIYLLT